MKEPRTKATSDRKEEIKALLSARDITPEAFLERALAQSEVEQIGVFRYKGSSWDQVTRVDTIKVGFDPKGIEDYMLERHGPGKYRFSPESGGMYLTHKVWAFGEITDATGREPLGGRFRGEDETDDITRDVAAHLKRRSSIASLQSATADQERAALESTLAPAKMAMDMMTSMKEILLKPQAAPDNGMLTVMTTMMTAMMTLVTSVMSQSNAQQAESTKMLLAVMERAGSERGRDGSLGRLVEAITVLEDKLGGGIKSLLDGNADKGSAGMWAEAITAAAPVLEKGLDVMGRRMAMVAQQPPKALPGPGAARVAAARPPIVVPSEARPVETPPLDEQGNPIMEEISMAVRLSEDDNVNESLHESAALGVELLKSRDFKSLERLLVTSFPDFLQVIDFDTNPAIYLPMLSRINAGYRSLRAEFIDFFKWLEENQADDEPETKTDAAPPPVSE